MAESTIPLDALAFSFYQTFSVLLERCEPLLFSCDTLSPAETYTSRLGNYFFEFAYMSTLLSESLRASLMILESDESGGERLVRSTCVRRERMIKRWITPCLTCILPAGRVYGIHQDNADRASRDDLWNEQQSGAGLHEDQIY